MAYRWLARYYDEMFEGAREPMKRARALILEPLLGGVESVCELACGTGDTALEFAARGMRVEAVDLSAGMCAAVRRKAREAGLKVRVVKADMREFEVSAPVDVVTCEYDAINHVGSKSDLARVARAVGRALRPGGLFYFDVNNANGFERYWAGTWVVERPGVMMVMRNDHSEKLDRAWSEVDFFIREGRVWRRRRERVEQVCWSESEVRRVLGAAGFERIDAWDGAEFFEPGSVVGPGSRTVYLARFSGRRGRRGR